MDLVDRYILPNMQREMAKAKTPNQKELYELLVRIYKCLVEIKSQLGDKIDTTESVDRLRRLWPANAPSIVGLSMDDLFTTAIMFVANTRASLMPEQAPVDPPKPEKKTITTPQPPPMTTPPPPNMALVSAHGERIQRQIDSAPTAHVREAFVDTKNIIDWEIRMATAISTGADTTSLLQTLRTHPPRGIDSIDTSTAEAAKYDLILGKFAMDKVAFARLDQYTKFSDGVDEAEKLIAAKDFAKLSDLAWIKSNIVKDGHLELAKRFDSNVMIPTIKHFIDIEGYTHDYLKDICKDLEAIPGSEKQLAEMKALDELFVLQKTIMPILNKFKSWHIFLVNGPPAKAPRKVAKVPRVPKRGRQSSSDDEKPAKKVVLPTRPPFQRFKPSDLQMTKTAEAYMSRDLILPHEDGKLNGPCDHFRVYMPQKRTAHQFWINEMDRTKGAGTYKKSDWHSLSAEEKAPFIEIEVAEKKRYEEWGTRQRATYDAYRLSGYYRKVATDKPKKEDSRVE